MKEKIVAALNDIINDKVTDEAGLNMLRDLKKECPDTFKDIIHKTFNEDEMKMLSAVAKKLKHLIGLDTI